MSESDEYDFKGKESGFDRQIDYEETKKKLIDKYNETELLSQKHGITDKRRSIYIRQLIYLLVAMIQLRNGCRVSEAVRAFMNYKKLNDFRMKVVVKISKSDTAKKNKKGEMIKPKPRYRNLVFPDWVEIDSYRLFKELDNLPLARLKQRTLDYLLKQFDFNTHSLRYSRINYLINVKKEEIGTVAKYVGHNNLNSILIYLSKKNIEKIDGIDE